MKYRLCNITVRQGGFCFIKNKTESPLSSGVEENPESNRPFFPREDVRMSKAELMKEFLKQSRKENGLGFREVGIRLEERK